MNKSKSQLKRNSKGRGSKKPQRPRDLPCITKVPGMKRMLMTYSQSIAISEPSAAAGSAYFYRLNSVYDPDFSGTGITATGYSTAAAIYNSYRVHRATIRFAGTPQVASGGFAEIVIAPTAISTIPGSPLTWRSIPFSTRIQATPNANGGPSLAKLTKTFDLAKVFNVTKAQYSIENDFSGLVGSNPARPVYLMVSVAGIGSGTAATLNYALDITYEVEWFQPFVLPA